jgi:hypothetical protein
MTELNGTSELVTVIHPYPQPDITEAIEANAIERDTLRADITAEIASLRARLATLEASLTELDPPTRQAVTALVLGQLTIGPATATQIAHATGLSGRQVSAALQGLKRASKTTNTGRVWALS